MKTNNSEKVVSTDTIRLTGDETRAIMKAAKATGPIQNYRCCGLVDLGIMRVVAIEPKDNAAARKLCWKKIRSAAAEEDRSTIEREMHNLSEFDRQEQKKEKGHLLTELGKQVARGVNIRMNGQFKQEPC